MCHWLRAGDACDGCRNNRQLSPLKPVGEGKKIVKIIFICTTSKTVDAVSLRLSWMGEPIFLPFNTTPATPIRLAVGGDQ